MIPISSNAINDEIADELDKVDAQVSLLRESLGSKSQHLMSLKAATLGKELQPSQSEAA